MLHADRPEPGPGRIVAVLALVALFGPVGDAIAGGDDRPVDVRTFVTRFYAHGIPYAEAKALGKAAIPELVALLKDSRMEPHWTKVVWVLGCIGDPSVTPPLLDFLKRQQGPISVDAFRAALAVLPSLGHVARGGDTAALRALARFTRGDSWQNVHEFVMQMAGESK